MSSGGGGNTGQRQMGDWAPGIGPYWERLLGMGNYVTGLGINDSPGSPESQYQRYPGQRIAGLNNDQNKAMSEIRHFVNSGGSPVTQAANAQIQGTLGGDYLTGNSANPYAKSYNLYSGMESPHFKKALQDQLGDITSAYQQSTKADTDRMFTLSGAFGGSAHQNAVANNQAGLGKTLERATNAAYADQFNRSAGIEESRLNRGSGAFEGERGRQMGAIPMGQNEQGLALQRQNALMGIGDIGRSLEQDQLNMGYADWQEQRNFPLRNLQNMASLLSQAQGGIGGSVTTTMPGYQASPFSQLMGGLLAYNSLRG